MPRGTLRTAAFLHLPENGIQVEAVRLLPLRKFPEARQELADVVLRRHQQVFAQMRIVPAVYCSMNTNFQLS